MSTRRSRAAPRAAAKWNALAEPVRQQATARGAVLEQAADCWLNWCAAMVRRSPRPGRDAEAVLARIRSRPVPRRQPAHPSGATPRSRAIPGTRHSAQPGELLRVVPSAAWARTPGAGAARTRGDVLHVRPCLPAQSTPGVDEPRACAVRLHAAFLPRPLPTTTISCSRSTRHQRKRTSAARRSARSDSTTSTGQSGTTRRHSTSTAPARVYFKRATAKFLKKDFAGAKADRDSGLRVSSFLPDERSWLARSENRDRF